MFLPFLFIFALAGTPWSSFANTYASISDFNTDSAELKALVFLSASCPCSQSHVDHLNHLQKQHPNLKIYGVMTDQWIADRLPQINNYYTKKNFSFPVIKDEKQKLIQDYKALKTPHVVLLKKGPDQSHQVIYRGGVSDQRNFSQSKKKFLAENLMALQKNTPIPYQQGRSLGCYIRRF